MFNICLIPLEIVTSRDVPAERLYNQETFRRNVCTIKRRSGGTSVQSRDVPAERLYNQECRDVAVLRL
ncbi:MAG: hypothetical protein KME54_29255 [Tolypothrix brevis GSE-NOS-MK-07-07A]|nr:hypothetical protein [Tolypothrix brevis GSE-NOS-MK-07-07A]